MSERHHQLLGRFRASAEERLQRCIDEFINAASAEGGQVSASVKRDLHTIKGESRMLGLGAISAAIHAAEDALAACETVRPAAPLYATIAEALAIVSAVLRDGASSEAEAKLTLAPVATMLRDLVPAHGAAPPRDVSPLLPPADTEATEATTAGPTAATVPGSGARSTSRGEEKDPRQARWVQVNAEQVDILFGNISEFSASMRALHESTRRVLQRRGALSHESRGLLEDFERLGTQLEDIESAAWTLRMVPIEPTLRDLAEHGKQLAAQLGKELRVVIDSGRAQIERVILDSLWDPLLHLVRNAVDHGLERGEDRGQKPRQGTLSLRAESVGTTVVVVVSDDGRGISLAAVRETAVRRGILSQEEAAAAPQAQLYELLFGQGFSTKSGVSDLSGRGVGLDVVRDRLLALGGEATLHSVEGQGSQLTLTLPARLSKERAIVFQVGEMLYALPGRAVLEILSLHEQMVQAVAGGISIATRYGTLPLASFSRIMGSAEEAEEQQAVVVRSGEQCWAFSVPRILAETELERRPCDPLLATVSGTYASALLGNGRPVLWLAATDVCRRATTSRHAPLPRKNQVAKKRVMVVDDSAVLRELMVEIFRSSGYEVVAAANGQEALALCERQLPDAALVDVEMPVLNGFELLSALRPRWPKLPVIMFTSRTSSEFRARAMSLGANAYLIKTDFDESRLVETLSGLLRGAS